ncbi:MAG: SPOR domain-containing protein [Proteobacteria bacterium]|nr:SPOR domain-containing protein [Pseudomonadota bacterium]
MTRNNEARREPTLADLEAFEKLLRDSLQGAPAVETPAPAPAQNAAAQIPSPQISSPQISSPQVSPVDHNAMAELARLIDAPLEFARKAPPPVAPAPPPVAEVDNPAHHMAGRAEADLQPGWEVAPVVETNFSAPEAKLPSQPEDPLAAFEAELRRFDAARQAELPAAHAPVGVPTRQAPEPVYADSYAPVLPPRMPEPAMRMERAPSPLSIAEERLAAEAAAAAAGDSGMSRSGRSRGVFLALGGLAAAGLAVVIGGFFVGGGSRKTTEGGVPVIAARPEPTKAKPADPGGVEIPNQNKQVLAPRGAVETKPAQVVNNTEQPLDLNQVTKRDGVRVIAPSPYQAQPDSGANEPRRVTSIRIPVPGGEAPPSAAPTGPSAMPASTPTAPVPGIPTLATGGTRPAPAAGVTAPVPPARPDPAQPPKADTRPVPATSPPKQEVRVEAPRPDAARTETPKVTPPPKVSPPRSANAPLPLDGGAAVPAASGGWAVQLASRPSEESARAAIGEIRGKYASALGGKPLSVVSGEANGNQVYRVRAGGYSQAAAVEACNKVKAAGGGCFVTKQ